MDYKEDWDRASERINAWWNREIIDRIAIQVTAPKTDNVTHKDRNYSLVERWTNPNAIIERYENMFENTYFGGEAYPYLIVTLGPSIIGALLGCELVFDEGTSWQKHFMSNIEDFRKVKFNKNNKWYEIIKNITDAAVEHAQNRYFVSIADLGASGDILAYMLGSEQLCYDLIENPDSIKNAIDYIMNLWFMIYNELFTKTNKYMTGSCMWLSALSSGKTYPLQCDFSAMISPKMFEEFFIPEIQAQCRFLDDPIYHLDGKEAIMHLDTLLEIPELKAIQWCPGVTGGENKSMLQWIPLLKKIQAKKKAIHIEVDRNEIDELLTHISPYGLMLNTTCGSVEEAKYILKRLTAR
jgi:hypothetical protein